MKKIFLVLLLVFSFQFSVFSVSAAETDPGGMPTPTSIRPTGTNTPCNQVTNNEFAPLRPYPGSPCDPLIPAQNTFQCGKSINAEGNFLVPLDGEGMPTCPDGSGDICLDKQIAFDLTVDLKDAKLPVLGNTQDSLDDAGKANQYLASYLNGTVQQADQGPLLGTDRLTSFAGPLKKLLPFDIQNLVRSKVAANNVGYSYHNYKIGCRQQFDPAQIVQNFIENTLSQLNLGLKLNDARIKFGILNAQLLLKPENYTKLYDVSQKIFAEGKAKPEYLNEVVQILVAAQLSEVSSTAAELITSFGEAYQAYMNLMDSVFRNHAASCLNSNDVIRLKDEADHLPPMPDDKDLFGNKKYPTFSKYWDAYLFWMGKLNVFNLFTINLPWVPDVWAELFQNVPFATLEDTVGEVTLSTHEGSQPTGVSEMNMTFISGDSRLYFAHLKNTAAMATLLQKLSSPKSTDSPADYDKYINQVITQDTNNNPVTKAICALTPFLPICNNSKPTTPRQEIPNLVYSRINFDQTCDIANVAVKNNGDDLMGKQINAKLTYKQKIRYKPIKIGDKNANDACYTPNECRSGCCLRPGGDPYNTTAGNCEVFKTSGAVLAVTDPGGDNITCVGTGLSCVNWASSCESIGKITTQGSCGTGGGFCCLEPQPTAVPTPIVSNKPFDPETCTNPQLNGHLIDSHYSESQGSYDAGRMREVATFICKNLCNLGSDSEVDNNTQNPWELYSLPNDSQSTIYYPSQEVRNRQPGEGGFEQFKSVKCWVPRYCRASPKIAKPTKAKTSVFSKMPLIDSIYETLVSAKDSFLRHLTPKDSNIKSSEEANPVGIPVNYIGNPASDNPAGDIRDVKVSAGNGNGSAPVIYLPKVGSLGDYLLGTYSPETVNLQKMFRPKE